MHSRTIFRLILMLGIVAVAAGFGAIIKYETTPGRAADADGAWPATGLLPAVPGKPALVMTVHPECPCSKASLGELADLVAKFPGRLACYVLFVPEGRITADACRQSELWRQASAIPGVTPLVDAGNLAITVFHARTSGQVLLYDTSGRLRFSGGITVARGHVGESAGSRAIASFLTTGNPPQTHTPVYGCALE